jgi:hypothetical protein
VEFGRGGGCQMARNFARRRGDVCDCCGTISALGEEAAVDSSRGAVAADGRRRELAGAGKVRRHARGEASDLGVGGLPRWFC